MPNVKLITKAPEFVRSEAWAIVRDDLLGKSSFPEDVGQHFCDSVGCLTVKDVIGEKTREVVECDQGMLALEVHQIHAQNFHCTFGKSTTALLDNLHDVIL